jgi:hypothetical protein
MLTGGWALVNAPAVIDVPRGKGHVVLFANNPMWRSETQERLLFDFQCINELQSSERAAPGGARWTW